MQLYRKLYLSIFFILPYIIIQKEFYYEFYIFLSKLLHKEIKDKIYKIIFSSYLIIYSIILILGLCRITIFEVIVGIMTSFFAIAIYKPFFIEEKKYVNYIPSFDILYIFIIGGFILIKGLIKIIQKLNKCLRCCKNQYRYLDNNCFIDKNNYGYNKDETKINNISIEIADYELREIIFYLLNNDKLKDRFETANYIDDKNLDIYFTDSNSIQIKIENLNIIYKDPKKIKKDKQIKINKFYGEFYFFENRVKKVKIYKGTDIDFSSCFFSFISSICLTFFKETVNEKIEDQINGILTNEIPYNYDNIFQFHILIKKIKITNEKKLSINLEATMKINNKNTSSNRNTIMNINNSIKYY